MLGDDYNTAIHICAAPEIAGRAVSERPDRDALMRRYREQRMRRGVVRRPAHAAGARRAEALSA